jgi:hypothetical protein
MYLTFLQLAWSLGKTVFPLTIVYRVEVSGVALMGFAFVVVFMPRKFLSDHVSERFVILSDNSWELSVLLPLFPYKLSPGYSQRQVELPPPGARSLPEALADWLCLLSSVRASSNVSFRSFLPWPASPFTGVASSLLLGELLFC